MELRKDTRNVTGSIIVEIIAAVPPIMEIECADPLLCLVGDGGKLFINPTSRLGVKALCSTKGGSDCSSMSYQWTIMIPGSATTPTKVKSKNDMKVTPPLLWLSTTLSMHWGVALTCFPVGKTLPSQVQCSQKPGCRVMLTWCS